jgi:hypothetical protein
VRLTTSPPSVSRLSRQCSALNISQLCRSPLPLTGIASDTFSYSINVMVLIFNVLSISALCCFVLLL